jgi:hypothetical protein
MQHRSLGAAPSGEPLSRFNRELAILNIYEFARTRTLADVEQHIYVLVGQPGDIIRRGSCAERQLLLIECKLAPRRTA